VLVGKQNKHCLCATCEHGVRGGYAPPGTYPETSDSEREKEVVKKVSSSLLNGKPSSPAHNSSDDEAPAVSASTLPTLTGAAKVEDIATGLPRRSLAPLVAVPSGVEDVAEGEQDATSYADTDGEIIDISDSEGEAEPAVINLVDSDVDTDDGRETDDGPQGAETDAPMDISDESDVDFPPQVKISLNPSSPPSSPHHPLADASAIAARLRLAQSNSADATPYASKAPRVKLRLGSSTTSAVASASHTPRPTLITSSASLPILPSQTELAVPAPSSALKRTRAGALSTPTGSAASTPPPSAPPELASRRVSSRLNLSKDKRGLTKEQAPTPPLSDEGLLKDGTLPRSLRSRPSASSVPTSGAQTSTRVTRRAFLKPTAPRASGTGTPILAAPAAPVEKKVARKGKDCLVCLVQLTKENKADVRLKCFR
jgi:hypothetical protein